MSHAEPLPVKAIFLDKDGTLVRDVPYNVDPALVKFVPGVFEGLSNLQEAGYKLVIISNQPGISLGYFSENQLKSLILFFEEKFNEHGLALSGFYYCPHLTDDEIVCDCRKPKCGLLLKAAKDLHLNLEASWMIGDILNDVEAGNRAGCRTALVDNGNETEWVMSKRRKPDYMSPDFLDIVNHILV